jgi:hypothetical protein
MHRMTDPPKLGRVEIASLACLLAIAVVLSIFTLVNPDVGFHLKAGAIIWDQWAIPTHDSFSYLAEGRRWVDSQWLFQLLIHFVLALGAAPGLVLLRAALVLGFLLFLLTASLRKGPTAASLWVGILVILASYQRFVVRPELLTFLFLASFVYGVGRLSRYPRGVLIALPLVQVIWSNSHGLWVLGPAYLGLHLLGGLAHDHAQRRWSWVPGLSVQPEERKREGILFGLCAIAPLANANGIDGILYPMQLLVELSSGVPWFPELRELASPLASTIRSPLQPEVFYGILVVVCVAAAVANRRNARLADWLPALAFLILSLRSARNMPLFAIVAMGVTVENLAGVWRGACESKPRLQLREPGIAIASLVMLLTLLGGISAAAITDTLYAGLQWPRRFGMSESETYPAQIVERLREKPGRFFNGASMGGYLIWKLYPDKQVAIDGRWEVYEELIPRMDQIVTNPQAFSAFAEQHGVTSIALQPASAHGRAMLPWLRRSSEYEKTFRAHGVVLFEKVEPWAE